MSIIVPSYNACEQLKSCILSIQNQSFKNVEVLIMDAQSTDGTLAFLETLQPPFYWTSEADNGIYDAMNKGIKKAKGQWLYFIGADDQLADDEVLTRVFENAIADAVELLIGSIKYDFKANDARLVKQNNGVFVPKWSSKLWLKHTVHHQGLFYKHSLFKALQYDLNYKILSDYNLNLKLYNKQIQVKHLNTIVAICGTDGVSKTYTWKLYAEDLRLKTENSSVLLQPVFFVIVFLKFTLKKLKLI
nr:glycosyltransferase family 2 protein [Psychroserpens sp. SPM9]